MFEVIVEDYVLEVEVIHCENTPPSPASWNSDWDAQGCRELEFKVVSAITYNAQGQRQTVSDCYDVARRHAQQIEVALWHEIDSRTQRHRRVA